MKQVIIARSDLNMSPGKLAAQVAHAAIGAYQRASKGDIDTWEREGVTKIVLSIEGREELLNIYERAVAAELPTCLIADEGRTEVTPGSITCCGIGPATDKEIDRITGQLGLYGKPKPEYNRIVPCCGIKGHPDFCSCDRD